MYTHMHTHTHTHTYTHIHTHTHIHEHQPGHCRQQVEASGSVLQVTLLIVDQEQGNLEGPMGVHVNTSYKYGGEVNLTDGMNSLSWVYNMTLAERQ